MAKRNDSEATTEDATDSIAPWQMLEDDEIATLSVRVREIQPDSVYIPFARRIDMAWYACFDRGSDGKGKSVVVVNGSNGAITAKYAGFGTWFDSATSDRG